MSQYFVKSENGSMIEIDENIKPTDIKDYPYLYHDKKPSLPHIGPNQLGKWMMFFKINNFIQQWKNCCKLYDEDKLIGIQYLTCSTGYEIPRYSGQNVIFFHCGPASNKDTVLKYGENLLKYIRYSNSSGYLRYKSREQTLKPTLYTEKYLYEISVPEDEDAISNVADFFTF